MSTQASEPVAARGPAADYCPGPYGEEGHHMVSHSAGRLVKFVERCSFCGWIDASALDRWAEQAIKNNLSKQAQRIAVAAGTEPFAFVQSSTEELTLREILLQALGAVHAHGVQQGLDASDGRYLSSIFRALEAEVERALQQAIERTRRTTIEEVANG